MKNKNTLGKDILKYVKIKFFRHTLAESATFPPCSEMGMWCFRPGYGEK